MKSFRTVFQFPNKQLLQWFPGHMGKGVKQMQQRLKNVDCIVEVHDARIPFSGRNRNFKMFLGDIKPHVLLLNKVDLADITRKTDIIKNLNMCGISNVLFTNCKDPKCRDLNNLIPTTKHLIQQSERYNRAECKEYTIMVIGVPNVGKSSVINSLRHIYLKKSKAAPVGGVAGITRSVTSQIKVSNIPLIYVLDTPGILEPHVTDMEAGFKLALCSSMQDHLVGITNIADYLLFWLNSHNNFTYVEYLGLKEPCDDISELLVLSSVNLGRIKKKKSTEGGYIVIPDIEFAATHFVKGFREGAFGKIMLDDNI